MARLFRTLSIGAATLALGIAVGSTAVSAADAARHFDARNAGDLAAQRHHRHFGRAVDRSSPLPFYEARPVYYRPYPYALPLPFFLGFGFGPRG